MWETGGPFIFNGTYDTSFSLDLQVKDVHLMYEMAKEAEVRYKKDLMIYCGKFRQF